MSAARPADRSRSPRDRSPRPSQPQRNASEGRPTPFRNKAFQKCAAKTMKVCQTPDSNAGGPKCSSNVDSITQFRWTPDNCVGIPTASPNVLHCYAPSSLARFWADPRKLFRDPLTNIRDWADREAQACDGRQPPPRLRLNEAQRRRLRQVNQRPPAEPDETGSESESEPDDWDFCTSAASELYHEIRQRLQESHDKLNSLTEEFQGYLRGGRRTCPSRRRVQEEVANMTRLAERIDALLRFNPNDASDSSDG